MEQQGKQTESAVEGVDVAAVGATAYVRIHGRMTFKNAADFRAFMVQQAAAQRHGILVDLHDCCSMDSTFIGMLTSMTLRLRRDSATAVKLFNASEHVLGILRTLGLLSVLDVVADEEGASAGYAPLTPGAHSKVDITRLMLDAHETLAAVNSANAVQFKDVVTHLKAHLPSE